MDRLAKEYVIDFFTKRYIHFKDSPEAVGWTHKGQLMRYEAVLKFIEPQGKSILDFGCGKGDFYGFLKERGIACNYKGIDINPSLIELARKKYRENFFYVQDVENEPLQGNFDYVVAIGVFNLQVQNVKETAKNCIAILFNHTSSRLVATFLNSQTRLRDIGVTYFSKDELIETAKALTDRFLLVDTLIEGEIFLILDRASKNCR